MPEAKFNKSKIIEICKLYTLNTCGFLGFVYLPSGEGETLLEYQLYLHKEESGGTGT